MAILQQFESPYWWVNPTVFSHLQAGFMKLGMPYAIVVMKWCLLWPPFMIYWDGFIAYHWFYHYFKRYHHCYHQNDDLLSLINICIWYHLLNNNDQTYIIDVYIDTHTHIYIWYHVCIRTKDYRYIGFAAPSQMKPASLFRMRAAAAVLRMSSWSDQEKRFIISPWRTEDQDRR